MFHLIVFAGQRDAPSLYWLILGMPFVFAYIEVFTDI